MKYKTEILRFLRFLWYGLFWNLDVSMTNITNSKVKIQYSDFKDKIMACYQLALLLYLSFRGWTTEISSHRVFFTDLTLTIKHNPPYLVASGLLASPAMFVDGIYN